MFFVIDKPGFQSVLSIVRDDRTKKDQGLRGPFLRLEAKDDYVKLDGLTVSGKFVATVYEPGVLFLKVTLFRRLLRTIKGQKFLSIQVTDNELVMDHIRMPLEANEMLLYADPDLAPQVHPSVSLSSTGSVPKPQLQQREPERNYPSWLIWNKPDTEPEELTAGKDLAREEQEKSKKQTATVEQSNDRIQAVQGGTPKAHTDAPVDKIVHGQETGVAHEPGEEEPVEPTIPSFRERVEEFLQVQAGVPPCSAGVRITRERVKKFLQEQAGGERPTEAQVQSFMQHSWDSLKTKADASREWLKAHDWGTANETAPERESDSEGKRDEELVADVEGSISNPSTSFVGLPGRADLARLGGWEGRLFGRIPYGAQNLRGRVALSTGIAPEFAPLPRHPQHAPVPDFRFQIPNRLTACRQRSLSANARP